jgi:hypothetical protein
VPRGLKILLIAAVCLFLEILAIGISMEVLRLFRTTPDPGLPFLLTAPLLGIAWIAWKGSGEADSYEDGELIAKIFTFATALSIVYMIGNWFLGLCWLAAFASVRGAADIAGRLGASGETQPGGKGQARRRLGCRGGDNPTRAGARGAPRCGA